MPTRFFAAGLLATVFASPTAAATIEVHQGQSIEAAIKRASPGDTVAVRAGTYHETVYTHASGVKIISADGKGAAHIVSPGTPLFIQGGSGNEIRGFRLTAGSRGNGLQVGGSPSGAASGYVVADNIVTNAGLDGIKVHQAKGFAFRGNIIENAGTGNAGNADGGIDFVAVTDSRLEGNTIVRTGGNSCVMLKGGTARNTIAGNSFGGCKEAIHVGGYVRDGGETPGFKEAFDNTITGNSLCASGTPFRLFPGEERRQDNRISGNDIKRDGSCSRADSLTADDAYGGTDGGDSSEANQLRQAASSAMAASCGSKWSAGMTGISGASGIFSGGRATLAAQLAQQIQLVFQSGCAVEQLAAQIKAIAGYKINTIDDVENVMIGVQRALGNSQRVSYDLAKSDNDWRRVFMETNGLSQMPFELSAPAIGKRYAEMREYAAEAMQEAARIRALAVTNMKSGNARTRKAMDASAGAVGPTQAVQAGNLLMLEARQELQGMHQTLVSYNEAQSRIEQSKAVETVLAGVFMDKNMQSMNTDPTPDQGAVTLKQPQVASGFKFTPTTGASAGGLSN